jgi:hypothetical protein
MMLGAKRGLEKSMTRSLQTRDASERAKIAANAMSCAIATGSLEICEKTVIWAKRFIKDPVSLVLNLPSHNHTLSSYCFTI